MEQADQCPHCGHAVAEKLPTTDGAVSLRKPVDPVRPPSQPGAAQPESFPKGTLVGIVMALIIGIVMLIVFTSAHGSSSVPCRGGPDKLDPYVDYRSNDGVHWTGTYACFDGGQTTIPVPRSEVFGEKAP